MNFLAADIGDFRSRLLIGDAAGGGWRVLRQETLASADPAGVDDLLARFLRPEDRPSTSRSPSRAARPEPLGAGARRLQCSGPNPTQRGSA